MRKGQLPSNAIVVVALALPALLVLLASCGGDDDDGPAATATGQPPAGTGVEQSTVADFPGGLRIGVVRVDREAAGGPRAILSAFGSVSPSVTITLGVGEVVEVPGHRIRMTGIVQRQPRDVVYIEVTPVR